jgi:hypothetical protein
MGRKTPRSKYLGTRYITDGTQRGVVRITDDNYVHLVDILSNRSFKIHFSQARRMTESEVEEYNATPAVNDPAPGEIAARTKELQATWSDEQRRRHICPLELFSLIERVF